MNILIVDDLPENLLVIESILAKVDAQLVTAASGHEALMKILQIPFSLILLDVQMPGMDGCETAEYIRKNQDTRHIPIIFVTALNAEKQIFKGYESGAVDYLIKPINPHVLLSKVNVFLEIDRQRLELEELVKQHQLLLNCAGEGIIGIDSNGYITYANPEAASILQGELDNIVDSHIHKFLTDPSEKIKEKNWKNSPILEKFLEKKIIREPDSLFWRASGKSFPVSFTCAALNNNRESFIGGVIVFSDISIKKEIEKQLLQLANFDCLTNLANRAVFNDFLSREINQAERYNRIIALLFVDLDNFKVINDSKGHDIGDLLLKKVASRLSSCVRGGDLVSRTGGDEFAVVLSDIAKPEDAARVAENIQNSLRKVFRLGSYEIFVTASIGIAVFPGVGKEPEDLTKAADIAMYHAKEHGRNNFQFFAPEMQEKAMERMRLENDLREAINAEQLLLHYQPQIDAKSSRIIGLEALVRWEHPELGMIGPNRFIPIAEESGLIGEMGEWIMKTACQYNAKWQRKLKSPLTMTVAVNVSVRQLKRENFWKVIEAIISETNLKPENLDVELTESTVMDDPEEAIAVLDKIHGLGVKIAIDDFGTGYSSLSYLRRLPIDILKIDLSFVRNIGKNVHDETIIKTIIALAHSLDLKVVAEGVETQEHVEFLKKHECDVMQGYFFSRPLEPNMVNKLLAKGLQV
jgi:diguanylate cyclase (GGDEF)-like protein